MSRIYMFADKILTSQCGFSKPAFLSSAVPVETETKVIWGLVKKAHTVDSPGKYGSLRMSFIPE